VNQQQYFFQETWSDSAFAWGICNFNIYWQNSTKMHRLQIGFIISILFLWNILHVMITMTFIEHSW